MTSVQLRRCLAVSVVLATASVSWAALPWSAAPATATTSGDYVVTADVRVDGVAAGVFFRAATVSNGYMWQLRQGSPGVLREHKVTNGVYSVLREVVLPGALAVNATKQLSIRAQGSTITTTLDGAVVDVLTDSSFTTGSVGVRTGFYETMSLDSLSVRDVGGRLLFDDDFASAAANRLACGTVASGRLIVDRIKACVVGAWDVPTEPTSLTADSQAEPLVVATSGPRFGWRPATTAQSAYRVVVATSPADALALRGVWDSGMVTSSMSQQVPYGGPQLGASTRYWWSVRTWDGAGVASAWSAPAEFGTASTTLATTQPIWTRPNSLGNRWTDYTVSADIRIDAGYAGLLFRAVDPSSGYMWQLRPGTPGKLAEFRVVNGTFQPIATVDLATTIAIGTSARLSVTVSGSVITTSVDGMLADARTDSTFASGSVGVRTASQERMAIDNLDVRSSAGAVLYATSFATETVSPLPCATLDAGVVVVDVAKSCLLMQGAVDWAFLRGSFAVADKAIVSATLFASGRRSLDARQFVFKSWMNGTLIAPGPTYWGDGGSEYFAGWDVTSLVRRNAQNVIGVQAYATANRSFVGEVVVQFVDGTSATFSTSTAGWTGRAGDDVYPNPGSITTVTNPYYRAPAENLDARVYPFGFSDASGPGADWLRAAPGAVVANLRAMAAPAVDLQLKTPVSMRTYDVTSFDTTLGRDVTTTHHVVDFGRTWVGGARLSIRSATAGASFDVLLGEQLDPSGNTVVVPAPSAVDYSDTWTVRDGDQTLDHWGYRVFRYADIVVPHLAAVGSPARGTGPLPFAALDIGSIRALAEVYPFDPSASALSTSSAALDRVWRFSKDSIEALNIDLYLDSPTRERAPYEADAYEQMLANHYTGGDVALGKVTVDWLLAHPTWPTEWKAYTVMSAYQYWLASGDAAWLATNYATLQARVMPSTYFNAAGLVEKPATGSATGDDIVDWPPSNRDGYQFSTINTVVNAFTYRALSDIASIALVLGKQADAAAYSTRAATLRAAMNTTLFDTSAGKYRDGAVGAAATHYSVHASVFAVALGVASSAEKPGAVGYIAQRGMACSIYCAPFLLQALSENGRADRAVELMTTAAAPGWIAMMDQFGAGSTMEAWTPTVKPNTTYSHPAGAVPAFVVPRFLFGVRPTSPAYASFAVALSIGGLTSGSTTVPTLRGAISVSFGHAGDGNGVTVTVPNNTTADVALIAPVGATLRVDGVAVAATRTHDGTRLTVTVPSGVHVVTVP